MHLWYRHPNNTMWIVLLIKLLIVWMYLFMAIIVGVERIHMKRWSSVICRRIRSNDYSTCVKYNKRFTFVYTLHRDSTVRVQYRANCPNHNIAFTSVSTPFYIKYALMIDLKTIYTWSEQCTVMLVYYCWLPDGGSAWPETCRGSFVKLEFLIVIGSECFDWLTNCQFTKKDLAAWKFAIIKVSI
jgi:hypothetical protein